MRKIFELNEFSRRVAQEHFSPYSSNTTLERFSFQQSGQPHSIYELSTTHVRLVGALEEGGALTR